MIREIFFEKASAQRKDSVEVARYERPYSTFGLRGGQLPRRLLAIALFAARTRPFIESVKRIVFRLAFRGKQKNRDKYPRSTT
jgi:hypothetical protein